MSSAGALHRPFVSFRVTILRDTQYTLCRIKWHGTVSYRPNIFCFFCFFVSFLSPAWVRYHMALHTRPYAVMQCHQCLHPPFFLRPPSMYTQFFILSVIPFVTFTRLSIWIWKRCKRFKWGHRCSHLHCDELMRGSCIESSLVHFVCLYDSMYIKHSRSKNDVLDVAVYK